MSVYKDSNVHIMAGLNRRDIRIIFCMVLLSTLGFFDFLIFMHLTDVISNIFFPSSPSPWLSVVQVTGVFAIGYLARPLGGLIFGKLGDRVGRKKALLQSMLLMAVVTLLMGLVPNYDSIGVFAPILFLILRVAQGVALGGQVPLTWVLIGETLPYKHISLGSGYVLSSYLLGLLVAVFFMSFLVNSMSLSSMLLYGWRIAFLLSGVLSLLSLYLFKHLEESPAFLNKLLPKDEEKTPALFKLLKGWSFNSFFICFLLAWFLSSIFMVIAILLPDLIQIAYELDTTVLRIANILGLGFMIMGGIGYGILADKFNPGKVLIVGNAILIVQIIAFFNHVKAGGDFILIFYAMLGFSAGIIGMIPAQLIRQFPQRMRCLGVCFGYNVIYAVVGGLSPMVLTYATTKIGMSAALYVTFMCLIAMIVGLFIYRLPDVSSKQLQ